LGGGDYKLEDADGYAFDSNCFFGKHPGSEPQDPHKFVDDPGFDISRIPVSSMHDLDAFRISPGSKCAGSARPVADSLTLDIVGTPLPASRDRGAVETLSTKE
jgi:hypothetical protein